MILATEPHYVLPASFPTVAVYLLALVAIVAWVLAHRLTRGPAPMSWRAAAFAGRTFVGFMAMLAVSQALQRGLVLATNWPIWPIALLGAVAVETVLALYLMERRTLSRRTGLALAVLRVALVALVVTMLTQPVRPWTLDKTIQRYVAVLLDTSASMYVPDTQLAPAEKIRLAEKFSPDAVRRPYALDAVAEEMERVRADLLAQGEWLASLAGAAQADRGKQLAARRDNLDKAFAADQKKLADFATALAKPLEGKLTADMVVRIDDLRKRLAGPIRDRLAEALSLTGKDNAKNFEGQGDRLLQAIRQAATDIGDVSAKTAALSQAIDESAYAALPAEIRSRVDSVAGLKRLALAQEVLLHRSATVSDKGEKGPQGPALLDQIQKKYSVKLYTFAANPAELDPKQWAESYKGPAGVTGDAATLPAEQQQTDLAAALEKITSEMADKQLSGILLLTDGRHNASKNLEPLVRKLGVSQVPISSIVFGADKPPMDAGIISVEAPETIATLDKMLVNAQLKLDGLAGKEVRVTLSDGDKVVDTQTVRVPTDTYRTRAQLSDEPAAAGIHHYQVEVQKFDGEVLTTNNTYPVAVSVTDDRTKLLIVEGRPRWEFRYLKNLFASRDKTVRLQYVLFEPDRIEGVPLAPRVEASVSRPLEDVEASALPKDEAEWMKFDVIILGDLNPKYLDAATQQILRKFVTERGGTLIVVAGQYFMPHAYADTPLGEALPVLFHRADRPLMAGPEKTFRIALTSEGRESVLLRQKVSPEESLEIWDNVPDLYWRHPILHAKEGATILAYALPPHAPDFLPARLSAGGGTAEALTDDIQRRRRDFERENALIVYQAVAMGQVMFLATDETWRLRYRTGDTFHHRFWGQVLRWATSNKLPAGTETVKLGTDRTRYAPQASVQVKAKVARKDYSPIVSDDVAVNVFVGDQVVLRKKLQYLEHSPGMYGADLGQLPGGTYRVELDAPPAKAVLAQDNVRTVATEFSVEPATPAEQAELAPDRGLLSRLASLTGGAVVDPTSAGRVLASLGKPTEKEVETHEYVLWDSWPLLILMILVATAEWLIRKKVGLA
jgi:hypothetical protein